MAFATHLRIMFRGKIKILILSLALVLAAPSLTFAQGSRAKSRAAQQKAPGETVIVSRADGTTTTSETAARTGSQDELTRATDAYKSSLRDLLALRERNVTEAAEQLEKLREL